MKIAEAIKEATSRLKNLERPLLESEILLSFFLGKERIYLHTHENEPLKNPDNFFAMVERRKTNEPLEYITKNVSFFGERFFIDYGALIPRPETEILIEKSIELINTNGIKNIAEIGTGSGIIPIMLKKLLPQLQIIASDISKDALKIAEANSKLHNAEVQFVESNLLDRIDVNIEMIISNPPYIKNSYTIPDNLRYEPQNALFGGEEGDEILKKIIDLAIERKVKILICEMGYDQREKIKNYMQEKNHRSLEFYKDLSGFDRGFTILF